MLCNDRHASRDTEWLSTMEWRVASQCTICTSTSSEVASSTGPLAKADQFPGEVSIFETTFCNLLIFHGFRLCFCTQGLKNDFALFLPLPLPRLTQSVRFLCQHVLLVAWHPILPIIISEHVDKRGLPTPSVQTFREFPCIVFKD